MAELENTGRSISGIKARNVWAIPAAVAGVIFFGILLCGFVGTSYVVEYTCRDMPRAEVYEAVQRDALAVKRSLEGWAISLAVSTVFAFAGAAVTASIHRRTIG
jgi:hypothetical protein